MIFTETKLKGAYIIDINRIEDDRGFFGRSYCKEEFEAYGLNTNIVQINLSYNKKKGTLRGLHIQTMPYGEVKLVRCTRGSIFDVFVDLRSDSNTFRQWIGVDLTADNHRMIYAPAGFAHGYIALEDNTEVTYPVTEFYTPAAERGFPWNDPAFKIEWPIEPSLISEKDKSHPPFELEWKIIE
ncbi:MAG: dTDP-4-dehydrorhamnose 3,5-epimerase [Parafilimonas sp.]